MFLISVNLHVKYTPFCDSVKMFRELTLDLISSRVNTTPCSPGTVTEVAVVVEGAVVVGEVAILEGFWVEMCGIFVVAPASL
jgi:hypothetical protein